MQGAHRASTRTVAWLPGAPFFAHPTQPCGGPWHTLSAVRTCHMCLRACGMVLTPVGLRTAPWSAAMRCKSVERPTLASALCHTLSASCTAQHTQGIAVSVRWC